MVSHSLSQDIQFTVQIKQLCNYRSTGNDLHAVESSYYTLCWKETNRVITNSIIYFNISYN